MSSMNPEICTIQIGKKELETYKVYPLSIGDQKECTDMLMMAFDNFQAGAENADTDSEIIAVVSSVIMQDLPRVLTILLDVNEEEAEKVFKKMTNAQLSQLVDIVWKTNYEVLSKNESGLFQKIKNLMRGGVQEKKSVQRKIKRKK